MPNIKSAKKRLRQSEVRRAENYAVRSRMRTFRRQFLESLAPESEVSSDATFRTYCSVLDKAVKKGVIKKNTAIRGKTRAAARLRAATAPVSTEA